MGPTITTEDLFHAIMALGDDVKARFDVLERRFDAQAKRLDALERKVDHGFRMLNTAMTNVAAGHGDHETRLLNASAALLGEPRENPAPARNVPEQGELVFAAGTLAPEIRAWLDQAPVGAEARLTVGSRAIRYTKTGPDTWSAGRGRKKAAELAEVGAADGARLSVWSRQGFCSMGGPPKKP